MSIEIYGFEWDPVKADINMRKHGVSFEEASTVFEDSYARIIEDKAHFTENEERLVILG